VYAFTIIIGSFVDDDYLEENPGFWKNYDEIEILGCK